MLRLANDLPAGSQNRCVLSALAHNRQQRVRRGQRLLERCRPGVSLPADLRQLRQAQRCLQGCGVNPELIEFWCCGEAVDAALV